MCTRAVILYLCTVTGVSIVLFSAGCVQDDAGSDREPTPAMVSRYSDNGDGTVTDSRTGLVWLKDADCFGVRSWKDAVQAVAGLNSGECGLSDGSVEGQWRLPTKKELEGVGTDPPATWDRGYPPVAWSVPGPPFIHVRQYAYWTVTTYKEYGDFVWNVYLGHGYVTYNYNKSRFLKQYVWPVR